MLQSPEAITDPTTAPMSSQQAKCACMETVLLDRLRAPHSRLQCRRPVKSCRLILRDVCNAGLEVPCRVISRHQVDIIPAARRQTFCHQLH